MKVVLLLWCPFVFVYICMFEYMPIPIDTYCALFQRFLLKLQVIVWYGLEANY